jgi:hypothetical protein
VSEFLYIIAIGVPVSTLICLLHAVIRRRMDLVVGGLPLLAGLAVFSLALIALFG